jgi:hypothetical protein
LDAIERLQNGNILFGGVGSGKTVTVFGYYMKNEAPRDIVVIATAKKRDSLDWEKEALNFGISTDPDLSLAGKLTVDSWNNIEKYEHLEDCFFIFDEQRAVGLGTWGTTFIKIAKKNRWLLLSATPGDTWLDYAPVFIANGFYKNITDFRLQHVVYVPRVPFPKVQMYLAEQKLERLRDHVLVEMPYETPANRRVNWLEVGYDHDVFNQVWRKRWNVYDDCPIKDIAELFRVMRKVVNMDPSRLEMIHYLLTIHNRAIIFYNFNYELGLLRSLYDKEGVEVGEWNGHLKTSIPTSDRWVYLVQYTAGSESWNCTETNATIYYSMTYSYKNFEQSMGRTDRMDTPFKSLYYYIFFTDSVIDRGIKKSLGAKKDFNERKFMSESMSNV